ncbi:MAG TPA: hypothetical protein VGF95_01720 [Solirubrobacteraceae bacterium]
MGLLDEAIKEHLELKRRRGADPHEMALLQHEAFGGDGEGAEGAEGVKGAEESGHVAERAVAISTNVNQETMEIDMSALLGIDEEISAERLEDRQIEARDARVDGEEIDEFAWEAPVRDDERPRLFKDRHLESEQQPSDEGQPASWI